MQNLKEFQKQIAFVGAKLDYYSQVVSLKEVREFSFMGKPPSTAYLKAGRCLSLLLKAFTCMDEEFRQIKDEEVFKDWDKI